MRSTRSQRRHRDALDSMSAATFGGRASPPSAFLPSFSVRGSRSSDPLPTTARTWRRKKARRRRRKRLSSNDQTYECASTTRLAFPSDSLFPTICSVAQASTSRDDVHRTFRRRSTRSKILRRTVLPLSKGDLASLSKPIPSPFLEREKRYDTKPPVVDRRETVGGPSMDRVDRMGSGGRIRTTWSVADRCLVWFRARDSTWRRARGRTRGLALSLPLADIGRF